MDRESAGQVILPLEANLKQRVGQAFANLAMKRRADRISWKSSKRRERLKNFNDTH
jgi:hypothetical protein